MSSNVEFKSPRNKGMLKSCLKAGHVTRNECLKMDALDSTCFFLLCVSGEIPSLVSEGKGQFPIPVITIK